MNNKQAIIISDLLKYLKELRETEQGGILGIISPTSYGKLEKEEQDALKDFDLFFTDSISYDTILSQVPEGINVIFGLGGGTAIDYAKYVAYKRSIKCCAIPSMLSTNVFATNKVSVFNAEEKHTENGVLPDEVLVDKALLRKSYQENLYGLIDSFSIFNALRDWKLATSHKIIPMDEDIYARAEYLLICAVDLANNIIDTGVVDYLCLFEIIRQSGYITNDYGSGRPESGSEHIMASAIEVKHTIPHALAVTLGIFIMTYYYNKSNYITGHKDAVLFENLPFERLNILDKVNEVGLQYSEVFEILKNLKPRKDKFTLVDLLEVKEQDYEPLKEFLTKYDFKF